MRFVSLLVSITFCLICACQPADEAPENHAALPRFEVVGQGEDFPVTVPSAFGSTRGWLVVREDRADPHSSAIKLPVAIVHTDAPTPQSPVVYLSGGPGTSAMRTAAYPGAYPWLEDRDFIVFGQRGTHDAKPALMCPEFREAVANGTDQVASVVACRERLSQAGIGLDHYHSEASAADLEDLRTALGIERWNLYGGSYGTRLALVYAKSFGEHLDAMVLDSPLPPNAIYDDQSAVNREKVIRGIAQDCAAQAQCAAVFPNLERRFFETMDALSQTPLEIDGRDAPVTGADLVSLLPLSSGRDVRRAPALMDRLARLDPAIEEGLSAAPTASNFAWGMRFSVWCSEALPFSKRSRLDAPGPALGGYESAAIAPEICEAWGVPPRDERVVDPVRSDVPTLILAGEFDPFTPPIWAELAAQTLPNSLVAIARGDSHSPTQQWGGDGCAMALVADFIAAPERVLSAPKSDYCLFNRAAPDYALALE